MTQIKITGSHLQPVPETLEYLRHETDVWIGVTILLFPGLNDDEGEIDAMTRWLHGHLVPAMRRSAHRP